MLALLSSSTSNTTPQLLASYNHSMNRGRSKGLTPSPASLKAGLRVVALNVMEINDGEGRDLLLSRSPLAFALFSPVPGD